MRIERVDLFNFRQYFGNQRLKFSRHDQQNVTIIHGHVPLKEMFGYATTLRSLSQGRASYSMEPSHYEEAPRNIQEEIVQQFQGAVAAGR